MCLRLIWDEELDEVVHDPAGDGLAGMGPGQEDDHGVFFVGLAHELKIGDGQHL